MDEGNEKEISLAPWTDEQIENIRAWQKDGRVHEYTCVECGAVLTVGRFWLECPNRDELRCRLRPTWVWRMTADGVFLRALNAQGFRAAE